MSRRLTGRIRSPLLLVGLLAALLTALHLYRLAFESGAPTITFLIRDLGGFLVGLVVLAGVYWSYRLDLDRRLNRRLAAWFVVGGLTLGVLGAIVALVHASQTPAEGYPLSLVVTSATVGAGVGLVVGHYDARSKRRDFALLLLHDVAVDLLEADSKECAGQTTVDAAQSIIGLSLTGLWLREGDRLEPVALSDRAAAEIPDHPVFERGDSLAWRVYESGEPEHFADLRAKADVHNPETRIRSEYIVPIGDHGVMISGSLSRDRFSDLQLELARLVAAHTELVFDRLERTEALRERERELAERNARLDEQNAQLDEQNDRLDRQNERLDQFASVVSHDLRNPINVLDGYLRLADEDPDALPVAKMRETVDRMDTLVDDLLALARSGEAIRETAPISIGTVAHDAADAVSLPGVEVDVSPDVPTVRADRSRLRQVFENLYRNVADHADAAETIRVEPADDGFAVEDDGPGIPPEDRETVFEYGHTDAASGTGLGLAIVDEIVRGHGWEIDVESGTDGGARFVVRVPEADHLRRPQARSEPSS